MITGNYQYCWGFRVPVSWTLGGGIINVLNTVHLSCNSKWPLNPKIEFKTFHLCSKFFLFLYFLHDAYLCWVAVVQVVEQVIHLLGGWWFNPWHAPVHANEMWMCLSACVWPCVNVRQKHRSACGNMGEWSMFYKVVWVLRSRKALYKSKSAAQESTCHNLHIPSRQIKLFCTVLFKNRVINKH